VRDRTAVWAAVEGVTLGEAWLRRAERKPPELVIRFEQALAHLERGVPFAYAVGRVGFRSLDLAIDERALIPRPETEGLIDLVLPWADRGWAADIGTGSGCIALALATEGQFERIVAVDNSPQALALTRENIARVAPPTPIEVCAGHFLEPLRGRRVRFRVIVATPPYLPRAEYEALDPSVRDFEPRWALESGVDGLDATRVILEGANALLEPGGVVALEIDEHRAADVTAVACAAGWRHIDIHNDLFGRARYAVVHKED
jgi:release factor glutamine methyltransferase